VRKLFTNQHLSGGFWRGILSDLRTVRSSPRIARAVNKVFDLHLLELAAPEYEVTGRDLVSKRLSDLSDAVREAKAALPA